MGQEEVFSSKSRASFTCVIYETEHLQTGETMPDPGPRRSYHTLYIFHTQSNNLCLTRLLGYLRRKSEVLGRRWRNGPLCPGVGALRV